MTPKVTGTHTSNVNPWDSYAAEMGASMSPELEAAVAEYAERMYDAGESSNQNKEELHRQKELSDETSKEYQWLKPEEYADQQARIGRILNHVEFKTLLEKAGLTCVYGTHPHKDKASLYISKDGLKQPEYACWVQIGQMPELSMMRFDDHGVPLNERRRGWRTCLLQIILKGLLTEEKANVHFGRPKVTEQYHRYNSMLQSFRNNGNSLTIED